MKSIFIISLLVLCSCSRPFDSHPKFKVGDCVSFIRTRESWEGPATYTPNKILQIGKEHYRTVWITKATGTVHEDTGSFIWFDYLDKVECPSELENVK